MILTNYSVYIPSTSYEGDDISVLLANALSIELLNYHVLISKDLFAAMVNAPPEIVLPIAKDLLARHTVGELTPPLFPNWENRTSFMIPEMVVQVLGYIFQVSGNDLYDPEYMKELVYRIFSTGVTMDFKTIELSETIDAVRSTQNALNMPQNRKQRSVVESVQDMGKWIPSAEARTSAMLNKGLKSLETMKLAPHDVLRFFAARYDSTQWILPHDVMYDSMTWQDRKSTMRFLNNIKEEKLLESMGHNRAAWERFFRHSKVLRQKQFASKYSRLIADIHVSIGSNVDIVNKKSVFHVHLMLNSGMAELTDAKTLVYRTFASRVQTAIDTKNFDSLYALMKTNLNYLMQNIGSVSNGVSKNRESEFLELVRLAIKETNASTLFSILQIDTRAKYRIIDIKGMTTVQPAQYSSIITAIQKDIELEITRRYSVESKIVVDTDIANNIVPFLAKNQNIDRGSKYSIDNSDYMYFYMKWIQHQQRTDLDHSWIIVKDTGSIETIAFYDQANSYLKQSGDIVSAPSPKGATEYSRLDLNRIPSGIRYIIPVINVYSGENFKECSEAYAGFIFSDANQFNPGLEHVRYELNQPAQVNMPFMIDVKKREIIVTDFNVKKEGYGNVARDSASEVIKVAEAAQTLNKMTIQRFVDLISGDDSRNVTLITEDPNEVQPGQRGLAPENLSEFIV